MCKHDLQYMRIAKIWSENSHANRHKVGAIIVKNNAIISDGYNGMPAGFNNCCEIYEPDLTGEACYKKALAADPRGIGCEGCCHTELINWEAKPVCLYADKCKFAKSTTKPEVLHAEANAITKLAKSTQSSDGATLYVTMSPCIECAKLIIQAGIKKVYYDEIYRNVDGLELLKRAGIETEQIHI